MNGFAERDDVGPHALTVQAIEHGRTFAQSSPATNRSAPASSRAL
jgi:hypothetical protein